MRDIPEDTIHICTSDLIWELGMDCSCEIPERMRLPQEDHILIGRETVDHRLRERRTSKRMDIDKSSLIADLGIDVVSGNTVFGFLVHHSSPYLEFYGEGFLILGFEHESEMEALISVELRNTDIVLVACDIESIGFAQLVHECIAELWIVLFDDHAKCENISNRADLHILFREDLTVDTEYTLAPS